MANVFYWPVALREGRNEVAVSDGAGHADTAVVYFHAHGGAAGAPAGTAAGAGDEVEQPGQPGLLHRRRAREEWPFYYEFDGSADSTFHRLPRS